MKRIDSILLVAATLATMGSCGSKSSQPVVYDDSDTATVSNINRDTMIYGLCGEGSAMNTLQLITDLGDTLTLSTAEANDQGKCYGGFESGDRMAVLLSDKSTARLVINQSALLGDWVMPNPLDGSDEVGISIKEGGIAESIDQSTITYKTWRLSHGKLEIVLVREGGSEDDETYLYDIVKLGPDSLVYKDADETMEYSRQKPKEEYGKGVKLEDSEAEFFM